MNMSRKIQRQQAKTGISPAQALQGLGQIGDLASKIDQFVAAAQKMESLAETFEGVDTIIETVKLAQQAVEEIQPRLAAIEADQETQRLAISQLLSALRDSGVQGLEAIEESLSSNEKADEPG